MTHVQLSHATPHNARGVAGSELMVPTVTTSSDKLWLAPPTGAMRDLSTSEPEPHGRQRGLRRRVVGLVGVKSTQLPDRVSVLSLQLLLTATAALRTFLQTRLGLLQETEAMQSTGVGGGQGVGGFFQL